MRKKLTLLIVFLTALCLIFIPRSASAQTAQFGVEDNAQILGTDVPALLQRAQEVEEQTKAGVFVVTTNVSTPANEFAKSYLEGKVGAGNNGVVLVINMNLRKVYIWATGNLQYYMTSSRIDSTLDVVQPALTANNYTSAVTGFFDKVSEYYSDGIPTSRRYTVDPATGAVTFHRSFQPLYVAIAVGISLIVAGVFVWTVYRRYQMKDGNAVWRYDCYSNGHLDLTEQQDILVNRFVTQRRIPRPQSGGGKGGMSGGSGGGRSF